MQPLRSISKNEKYVRVSFEDYISPKPMIIVATDGFEIRVSMGGSNYKRFNIY